MIARIAISMIIMSTISNVMAQHVQYSQYNFTIQRVNPGAISLSDYAQFSTILRTQKSTTDVTLNSAFFSAKYPLISANGGKRWSSVAASFLSDRIGIGGILQTNQLGITYALNFETGKYQTLSMGIKTDYKSQKINIENLFTGSQYVYGQGFLTDIDPGENLDAYNNWLISISGGIIWQKESKDGERKTHTGISIFDFNNPDEGLLKKGSLLPATIIAEAGFLVYKNRRISIYPEINYSLSHATQDFIIGVVTSYDPSYFNPQLYGQKFLIITKYRKNEGGVLGAQWKGENLTLGLSFDIPINGNPSNSGALEIGLELGKLIKSRYKVKKNRFSKRRRNKNKKSQEERFKKIFAESKNKQDKGNEESQHEKEAEDEEALNNDEENSEKLTIHKSADDMDSLLSDDHIDSISVEKTEEIDEPEYIEVNYSFDFGETKPKKSSEYYVQEIKKILRTVNAKKILIIGHTDNIGSTGYNRILSEKRAKFFYQIFIKNGLDKKLLEFTGKGEEEPLNDNSNDELRKQNRRVEIRIYY